MDSATVLYWARAEGFVPTALSFCYGQRHSAELQAARRLAREVNCELVEMDLDLAKFGASALTDPEIAVPEGPDDGIPVTYVPARNTVFLSIALALARGAGHPRHLHRRQCDRLFRLSGLPGEFISAFEKTANLATRDGVEGRPFRVHTPLIDWTKAEIIRAGMQLGVDMR